ncbi:hypothetical protein BVRB_5g100220 [Beta vulgaris subsp. vulgaris]|nr:hypothetical protein BVRB_5g100220 [Beta vulgaris subsp. vulgaris]
MGVNPRRGGHPDHSRGDTSKLSLYQPSRLIRGTSLQISHSNSHKNFPPNRSSLLSRHTYAGTSDQHMCVLGGQESREKQREAWRI